MFVQFVSIFVQIQGKTNFRHSIHKNDSIRLYKYILSLSKLNLNAKEKVDFVYRQPTKCVLLNCNAKVFWFQHCHNLICFYLIFTTKSLNS